MSTKINQRLKALHFFFGKLYIKKWELFLSSTICMYVCMDVWMYVCTYVCVCMYVCMYVNMYVCMYVCFSDSPPADVASPGTVSTVTLMVPNEPSLLVTCRSM